MLRSSRAAWSRRPLCLGVGLALLFIAGSTPALGRQGYLRFPDIHGQTVVFTAEGDLWTAPAAGGEARRITSHPGSEVMACFSPDGNWIAFGGDYDGNRDVYVMPAGGGEPRRLTWNGGPDEPLCWSPDGKEIVFRSLREHPHFNWEAFTVPVEGGEPRKLPVGHVVQFAIDGDGGRYAFTRIGGGGTWKRYRGGSADDIWVGDPREDSYKAVTSFKGMDNSPMWHDGRIYFVSDQGGTANLWSITPDGSDRRRLTDLGDWDARWAAIDDAPGGGGRIVFTLAGDLHVFDPATGAERAIPIEIPSERFLTRQRYPNPGQFLTGYALAPDGDRLAVVARGELFSVPAKDGVTLPITPGSAAREGRMSYDPKGERILYVTDDEGEEAIAAKDAWGRGEPKKIVKAGLHGTIFPPAWSPDGKWIAYGDQTHSLFVVKADGGEPQKVDSSKQWEINQYSWSPDGRWLAYSKLGANDFSAIFLYDTKEGKVHQVTGWTTKDHSPTWDPKGRYLYFLSDRTVNPWVEWDRDFETINPEPTRPYIVLLRPDVDNPVAKTSGLPPKEGDEKKDEDKNGDDKKDKGGKDGDEEKIEPVEIVLDGLSERIVEVPVEAGRYYGLGATEGKLFYLTFPNRGIADESPVGDDEPPSGALMSYDFEQREAKPFLQGVRSYDLQPKSGKIAVDKGRGEIVILDAGAPPGDDLSKSLVKLENMVIELNPQEEWRQMYYEGWRWMRDYFWDAQMHGVDWIAIRDQYATLLPRIASRDELQDLLAEMIGELSNSHTYVWGGDRGGPQAPMVSTGSLGAVLRREGAAYRVERIYRGDPADRVRSPLQEPPADVKEGEYILAVNHRPIPAGEPFEASLQNLAGKEVLLTVNKTASLEGARDVVVRPFGFMQDARLRYADWVRGNREYVAQKTGGKMGYVHIPDMGGRGLKEFTTWFYPQLEKEGMVIDARWNGGGFVSQLLINRLTRSLLWWDRSRGGAVSTYPYRVLNGPSVVLTNEFAGSDGDIFPAAVQTAKLAPVIGKRSWGGVVGIRGGRQLVDSGVITQPEFAWFSPTKGWGLENHGVDPDIEVENLPHEVARGIDRQLDRAIEELQRLRETRPPRQPEWKPAPDHSRKAYQEES